MSHFLKIIFECRFRSVLSKFNMIICFPRPEISLFSHSTMTWRIYLRFSSIQATTQLKIRKRKPGIFFASLLEKNNQLLSMNSRSSAVVGEEFACESSFFQDFEYQLESRTNWLWNNSALRVRDFIHRNIAFLPISLQSLFFDKIW